MQRVLVAISLLKTALEIRPIDDNLKSQDPPCPPKPNLQYYSN